MREKHDATFIAFDISKNATVVQQILQSGTTLRSNSCFSCLISNICAPNLEKNSKAFIHIDQKCFICMLMSDT